MARGFLLPAGYGLLCKELDRLIPEGARRITKKYGFCWTGFGLFVMEIVG